MNSATLTSRELRQTVHCLELYYRQGRSQKDIARALGVSAATVSRLLQRAMDEGLVRVELDLPRREQLEAGLVEQFGLRDAVVVAAGGRGDVKEELDRKSTRLNSSHLGISYAVFCLKKKK